MFKFEYKMFRKNVMTYTTLYPVLDLLEILSEKSTLSLLTCFPLNLLKASVALICRFSIESDSSCNVYHFHKFYCLHIFIFAKNHVVNKPRQIPDFDQILEDLAFHKHQLGRKPGSYKQKNNIKNEIFILTN